MTSIVPIFARSNGEVNENGEGRLRDAYLSRHVYNWMQSWPFLI